MTCDAFEFLFLLIARWKELPFFLELLVMPATEATPYLLEYPFRDRVAASPCLIKFALDMVARR